MLVKSRPFNNVITNVSDKNILVTPNGGFGGFVSKVGFYPKFITPRKAWDIYKNGVGDALDSALNKYNMFNLL